MDISEIAAKIFDALWQVLLVGIVLGVGLPALFALGIRSLERGRTVVAVGEGSEITRPSAAGRAGAVVCFAVCVLAVAFGIVVVIFGKKLFGV